MQLERRDAPVLDRHQRIARLFPFSGLFPPHCVHQQRGHVAVAAVFLKGRHTASDPDTQVIAQMELLAVDGDGFLPFAVRVRGEKQLAGHRVGHPQPENEKGLRLRVIRQRRPVMQSFGQRVRNDRGLGVAAALNGQTEELIHLRRSGAVVRLAVDRIQRAVGNEEHVAISLREQRSGYEQQGEKDQEAVRSLRLTIDRRSIAKSSVLRWRKSG